MDQSKMNDIERDLIEGFDGFVKALKSDEPISSHGYTCRRIVLDLQPTTYGPQQVKATRILLKASQALFAQFLGVSVKTVRSWEQGKPPSDMACRFMDEIQRDPEYWQDRIKSAAKVKTTSS